MWSRQFVYFYVYGSKFLSSNRCGSAARPAANFNLLTGLSAESTGCEAQRAEQPADDHPQRLSRTRSVLDNVANRCIFSLPDTATQSICADLLEILTEILSYGTGGLFTPLNLFLLCLTGVCQT